MAAGPENPPSHPNGVVVGLREIWDALQEQRIQASRIEGKLDAASTLEASRSSALGREIAQLRTDHEAKHADHETRIRDIEKRPVITTRAMWTGLGVLFAGLSSVVAIVTALVP